MSLQYFEFFCLIINIFEKKNIYILNDSTQTIPKSIDSGGNDGQLKGTAFPSIVFPFLFFFDEETRHF